MERSIENICKILENSGGFFDVNGAFTYCDIVAIYRALKYAKENGANFPNLEQMFNDYEEKIKGCEIIIDWETIELLENTKEVLKSENN